MFGASGNDHAHPVVWGVEVTVGRLEEVCRKMEGVADPWLQRLRDCYQFHHIKQTASKVSGCVEVCGMYVHMYVQYFIGLILRGAHPTSASICLSS